MAKLVSNMNEELPLTPRSKVALSKAAAFAKECDHSYIGTEHLMVGLLSLDGGYVIEMLNRNGVDVAKLRAILRNEIKGGISSAQIPKTDLSEVVALMRMLADRLDKL